MPWEEFDKHIAQKPTHPMASITTRGILSFNKSAYEALGEPKAVTLLFDKESRKIGLKPSDTESARAYNVRKQPNSNTYNISLMKFANYYQIPLEGKRYTAVMDGKVLVIDLEQDKEKVEEDFDNMPF